MPPIENEIMIKLPVSAIQKVCFGKVHIEVLGFAVTHEGDTFQLAVTLEVIRHQ